MADAKSLTRDLGVTERKLLEELRDLAPDYRRVDVEARIRGLQMIAR